MLPEPHQLPEEARTATVSPGLSEGSLTSIGQCCDYGCQVTFDRNKVKVKHKREIVQQGNRNHINELSYFQTPTNHHLNYIVPKTNAENLARFIHGAAGSPIVQTVLSAINKGHYTTCP